MRVCILTSNKPRHRFMANRIAERFEVAAVFSEAKSPRRHLAERVRNEDMEGGNEIARYLDGFIEAEKKHLPPDSGEFLIPKGVPFHSIDPDTVNEPELVKAIRESKADAFAVFGTSLIKRGLMELSPHFVNIHLGLSPYYRGVACSFWPFFNDQPEYVGVTVFNLDEGIDSGPIIHQALVDLEPGDFIHDAGVKAIIAGVDLQIKALEEISEGTVAAHPQDLDIGRVYYNKDFNVHVLRECLAKWDRAMFSRYLADQDNRKAALTYIP